VVLKYVALVRCFTPCFPDVESAVRLLSVREYSYFGSWVVCAGYESVDVCVKMEHAEVELSRPHLHRPHLV
jgi:hypothetical protein